MTGSDTHKRAALRGREAVAIARIRSGMWAIRVFALLSAVTVLVVIFGPGGPHWVAAGVLSAWAAALLLAAKRIERGSRMDACILFALLLLGDVARWLTVGTFSLFNAAVSVAVVLATGNAVLGTFQLARLRRDASLIPPAPKPAG